MAFNNVGLYLIGPGQTGRYYVSFGGADKGAQYIMAHPLNPGGSLQLSNQTKTFNTNNTYYYWVTVQNIGNVPTNLLASGRRTHLMPAITPIVPPSSTRITVVLDHTGQVVGASYQTAASGVTSGQVAGPGQSPGRS